MWDWLIPALLGANIWVMVICAQAILTKLDEILLHLRGDSYRG